MSLTLSERCLKIAPSATLAMDAKAKAMIAAGEDVIGFGAGEPDFDTPEYIRDACKDALDRGMTRYTPVAGTMALRNEICNKFQRDNGLTYEAADIIVSNGAKQSISVALSALLNPGDEVLLPAPCWVSYPEMVQMAGGTCVYVPSEEKDNFVVTAKKLSNYITKNTKALILNSPCNPTGALWTRDQLKEIADLAVKCGFYVISDEIYEKLIYDGHEHVSIASFNEKIKQQTIVVNGPSKAYAMTGWRIGYAAGPRNVIKAMTAFQSHATSGPNTMAQYATMVAMQGGEEHIETMRQAFDNRRKLMYNLIEGIDGLSARMPQGAFYMMIDITSCLGKSINGQVITGSLSFAEQLLAVEKVAVVPGGAFGADTHVRVSYATSPEKIQTGLDRIAHFVKSLQ